MYEHELRLYAMIQEYTNGLVDDLSDHQLTLVPIDRLNPPLWILGHLAICTDDVLRLSGEPTVLPESCQDSFGPGSTPLYEGSVRPTKQALVDAFKDRHKRAGEALSKITVERCSNPHPVQMPLLVEYLPTIDDLIAHLLTTHEAVHLG